MVKSDLLKGLYIRGKALFSVAVRKIESRNKPKSFIEQIEERFPNPLDRVDFLETIEKTFSLDRKTERQLVDRLIGQILSTPNGPDNEPKAIFTLIKIIRDSRPQSILGRQGLTALFEEIDKLPIDDQFEMLLVAACCAKPKSPMETRTLKEFFMRAEKQFNEEASRIAFFDKTCAYIASDATPNGKRIIGKIKNKCIELKKHVTATKPLPQKQHHLIRKATL